MIGPDTHICILLFAATKNKRLPAARLHFTLRRFCSALAIIFSRFLHGC